MVNRSTSLQEGSQYEYIKCVIVGDPGVGKTCLTCAWACGTKYTLNQLVKTHVSTVWAIDHYRSDKNVIDRSWCNVDGVRVSLKLWDTFGYHDKNRRFAYRGADVVLLCFSVVCPSSLRNIQRVWLREIQDCCPATPIVVVGTQADMRYVYRDAAYKLMNKGLLYKEIESTHIITPDAGRETAKQIGAPYYETSVLTEYGIDDLFFNVIRAAMVERRKLKFWNPQLRRVQYPLIQPPMDYPIPDLAMVPYPKTVLQKDLSSLLLEKFEGDILFEVQGVYLQAHKICLASSDEGLQKVLLGYSDQDLDEKMDEQVPDSGYLDSGKQEDDKQTLLENEQCSCPQTLEGDISKANNSYTILNHPGFVKIEEKIAGEDKSKCRTVITVDSKISPSTFECVLSYLYTGQVSEKWEDLAQIEKAANLLMLPSLAMSVSNICMQESFLNLPLEKKFIADRDKRLKEIGLDRGLLADVYFQLDDGIVAGHKPILMARCEMMNAMFSANFMEASAHTIPFPGMDKVTFESLLEYLYTGSLPSILNLDVVALIEAANRLCLRSLVEQLEYSIVTELLKQEEDGQSIVEDVLTLIESAQLHNAERLAQWCLEYTCIHYDETIQLSGSIFDCLQKENKEYIHDNRWPPAWYQQELKRYHQLRNDPGHRHVFQQKNQFSRWQRCKSSCSCFGRRRKIILSEQDERIA